MKASTPVALARSIGFEISPWFVLRTPGVRGLIEWLADRAELSAEDLRLEALAVRARFKVSPQLAVRLAAVVASQGRDRVLAALEADEGRSAA